MVFFVFEEYVRYGTPFIINSVPKSQHFINNVLPILDENRFKQIVRVSWSNFKIICDLIKEDPLFNGARSCRQIRLEVQVAIVLYRLGSSGEGATINKIASLFGIGDGGTLQKITERVFRAILNLKNRYLYWPSAEERNTLVAETFDELPHCIGYVDGTEIKLAEKPSDDPEAYFSRKHIYSMKVQAVCDHKRRIRHIVVGYPGSVHDAKIYKQCSLAIKPEEFFSGAQWIAGDSAYKLTETLITQFRSNSAEFTTQRRNSFNLAFRRYRVRIEHCFGILKERFNSLKELKLNISGEASIKRFNRWVLVCAILHNILIANNANDFDEEYSGEEDNEEDYVGPSSTSGETKRCSIMELMEEQ